MHDDLELINRVISGDNKAYEKLYTEYFGMVSYLVRGNQGTDTDAHDVFHDTIIVILEKAREPGFKLTASIKTLIYSIARNIWYAEARKNNRLNKFKDYESYMGVDEDGIAEKEKTEAQLNMIEACLEKLGDPCKTLLVQFYYFKTSMSEVANMLGYTSADHAKAQKYKCMKRLQKLALNDG